MSVAAAELPELSRTLPHAPDGAPDGASGVTAGEAGEAAAGRVAGHGSRVDRSLRQIALLVVPTVVGYLVFGYLVVGAIFRTGSFDAHSNLLVYGILAAYTLGLPASAGSRLFQNVFFALGDTRTPAKIAAQRVILAATVAVPAMFALDRLPVPAGLSGLVAALGGGGGGGVTEGLRFGAVGLAVGSAVGAWYELVRLVRAAHRRLADLALPGRALARQGVVALGSAAAATLVWWALPPSTPLYRPVCDRRLRRSLPGRRVVAPFPRAGGLAGPAGAPFPEITMTPVRQSPWSRSSPLRLATAPRRGTLRLLLLAASLATLTAGYAAPAGAQTPGSLSQKLLPTLGTGGSQGATRPGRGRRTVPVEASPPARHPCRRSPS